MAVITPVPIEVKPHRLFATPQDAFEESVKRPSAFTWHLHAPLAPDEEAALKLRDALLLGISISDMSVSEIFQPQGPHINAPYFSAYFPGFLRNMVRDIAKSHGAAPSMIHPVTGHQFAEHNEPLAEFFGFMPEVIDYEKLKEYDRAKGIEPILAIRP